MGLTGFQAQVGGLVPGRKITVDWHRDGIVVEYDGIMHDGPTHLSRGEIMRDQERATLLQLNGCLVIRCNAATVTDGRCQSWIETALAMRGGKTDVTEHP